MVHQMSCFLTVYKANFLAPEDSNRHIKCPPSDKSHFEVSSLLADPYIPVDYPKAAILIQAVPDLLNELVIRQFDSSQLL